MIAETTPSADSPGFRQHTAPFIKFVGGKRQLLPEILARTPSGIHTYYEPFVGGGAVFFALATDHRFKRAVLGDINRDLIDTYWAVRDDVDGLIKRLRDKQRSHSEAYYYAERGAKPSACVDIAARFIYLNKACFNGLYRVNRDGQFNVPFGKNLKAKILDEDRLRAASSALQGVELLCCDFSLLCEPAERGDFVYLDPPYVPVSKTSNFTTYAPGGFSPVDQENLAELMYDLRVRGVLALLSNADCAQTRQLYAGMQIESVSARRAINSDTLKRGNVGELLVTNQAEAS